MNLFRCSGINSVLDMLCQMKNYYQHTRLIDYKICRKNYCYYYLFDYLLMLKNDSEIDRLPYSFLSRIRSLCQICDCNTNVISNVKLRFPLKKLNSHMLGYLRINVQILIWEFILITSNNRHAIFLIAPPRSLVGFSTSYFFPYSCQKHNRCISETGLSRLLSYFNQRYEVFVKYRKLWLHVFYAHLIMVQRVEMPYKIISF